MIHNHLIDGEHHEGCPRCKAIKAGKLWTITSHESITHEVVYFEGSRTACIRWLRENHLHRAYKCGKFIRLSQIIFELK